MHKPDTQVQQFVHASLCLCAPKCASLPLLKEIVPLRSEKELFLAFQAVARATSPKTVQLSVFY